MIADIYELSSLQAGMLFHRLFAPDSTAYFDQFSCRISGDVDPGLLRRAWQQLVDRHPVLRTSFHWEGLDKPVQVVHAEAALPWDTQDWRGVSPDEQAARWTAYLAADRARGFQPDVAPLMRAAIVRLTERDYYFCWSHHHLLLDGWCLQLVLSELFERYDALTHGRVAEFAPVRPYGEYIKWLQRQDQDAIVDHWRTTLRGFSAATPLFASAGTVVTGAAQADAVVELRLDQQVSDSLRTLASRHRLTLNTLVQGAWALVLSRYSGSDDVVFGVTVSGRPPDVPGIETMLGVFINTLPARVQVPGDATAAAWLAGVQAQQVAREPFAAIPLSEIQKLADLEPGAPLFDTNVIVMNYRMDEALAGGAAGLTISDLRIVDQTDIPLTLQVTPGRRIALEILYDRSRFNNAAMTRMLGHVAHLLTQFLDGLDRPLSAFEIVTAAERAQILDEFNATDAPLDPRATAIHMWEAQVAATPEAIALECNETRLTYHQLNEWANRLARGLQQRAPVDRPLGTDTLVAIAFARSERLVAAILAVWKCGAAYVPIDPDYPAERIRQVIENALPCVVLRDTGTVDPALETTFADRVRFASFDEVDDVAREAGGANLERYGTGADLAYVIFTSGSTGQPKGAMVEQTGLLNHILAKIEDLRLDDRSVVVQNASHCFDISVWQCFAALLAGGRTLVYTDALVLDPAQLLERVRTDRVTVLEVVPSYLTPLLDRAEDDRAGHGARPFGDLHWLLVTGETVKPSLVERWFRVCPTIPVVNAYGPTEASDDITHAFMREAPLTPTVPVGKPVRNFHIYVVDEQLRLCPIGVPGELCVSGPGVGRGYLNDPVRTAAVFLEDPFRAERGVRMYRTGDVGWFDADGVLLLSGRKDHQVKVRGYRIELGDIEAALTGLEAVGDAVVVDRHDRAAGGTYLAAYVTLRDPSATATHILGALADRLPGYMVPSSCTVLDRLPLTPNGKIDRKALPAPVETSRVDTEMYVGPRTSQEHTLAEIWGDVLGVARPGIHDNFFAVGGDSILSMQIVSRASRAGFAITPRDVFQHQTIAELAAVARPVAALPTVGERRVTGPARLAPAQQQFFEDVTVDRHHYNQSILLEVPAGFEPERFRRAFAAVVGHHEALRLRFTETNGVWRQTVAASEASAIFETHAAGELEAIAGRVQASLDLARGPLVRAAFIDRESDEPGRLLIVAHHLAVDGVSWRIILDDLAAAYEALGRGETVALPPVATPFLDWADAQADAARVYPAAHESNPGLNTVGSAAEVSITVDAATTRRFQTMVSGTLQTGPTALLLAAAALAYAKWSGGHEVRVDLETHGRDDTNGLDLTRTVGWFTSTVPVAMDLPADTSDPTRVVVMATEALRHAIEASSFVGPRPSILLNYHGRIDSQQESRQGWRLSSDPHGPDRSPRQAREYPLEINGLVAGGHLRITVGYSRNLHGDEAVAALARHLEAQVTALVAATPTAVAMADDVEEVYDLSPTQQGVLFHGLVAQTSDAYFNQLTCVLQGALDVEAFVEAWRVVTARHAALRTSFHWQGLEHPVQAVHRSAEIPWVVDDWSALPSDLQERRWIQQGDDDRRRPFDVSVAPLMRCALVRTGVDVHRFRWSQHHLLLDGWSASIVLHDVLTAYDVIARGGRFDAPAPPPFRDHIHWLARQDQAAAGRFWRQELAGFDQPTPLVLGLPEMDGTVRPSRMAEAERHLPDGLAARLMSLSAANRVTLHTLFQGIWALLLGRHGGTTDVVFGSIVSGRSTAVAGSDEMVGLFLNTIPARVRLVDEAPIFDWLRGLQDAHAAREEYAYSPLADVQRESAVPGGESLFDTILIFENYPVGAALAGTGHTLSIADVRASEPNNYAMTCVVTPGDDIALKIMFDEGRFDRATIDRTLDHLIALLSGIADAPEGRLGRLSLLTPSERAQMDRWNQTTVAMPSGETVLSLIEAHARRTPDRIAVVCDDRRVTYGALNARANQLARVLRASGRLGQGAGPNSVPRVVVRLRRSAVWPETVLALWKCGAAYVPIDPEYPAERVNAIITNARPALVIDEALLEEIADARANEDDADLAAPQDPATLAYVIYTSGSTGAPKGAMVEHAGFLNHVLSMVDDLALTKTSVVAQTASHSFDISMWQMFAALVAGGTTMIYPDAMVRRPDALAARLEDDAVSVVQFVPSYLNVFLDAIHDGPRPVFGALTHMVVIGEALSSSTIARWFLLYPHIPLMNTYGPTEASDSVTHVTLTGPLGGALVPIGRPIRNMTVYVVDEAMRPCPVGVKGEILIGGIGVGRGYLFDDERTRIAFLTDPFRGAPHRVYRSGDIGCLRPDGALLFFGRRDHQVKIRGHRIELGEIESCLAAIDDVRDAVVVAGGNTSGDLVLCAYVTAQGGRALDPDALTRHMIEHLPRHVVPDVVRVLPEMPVMPNGKVDRRALQARPIAGAVGNTPVAPQSDTERALVRIWSAVLRRDDIGVDESFFDIGGHSLKAIQIVSRINRDLGAGIDVADIFECVTVRQLAARVDQRSLASSVALVPQPDQEDYDPSPTQARMWLASRTPEGSAGYNMAGVFQLEGAVDASALARAFRALVARHEALRTVFVVRGGALRQKVLDEGAVGEVFRLTDVRGGVLGASDADELDRAIQTRIATPMDLSRGPLFDTELLRVTDGRSVLIVRLHHIVGDAGSIRIVLREALALYAAFRRGETAPPLAPLPIQYRDFVAWRNQRAAAGAREKNRRYWLDTLSAEMPRTGFVPDTPDVVSDTAPGITAIAALDDAQTSALRAVAARHGTTPFGVIVAAVYALLHRYRQQQDLVIGSTVSLRDHPLLEDQVGCYIDTLVLRGTAAGHDTATDLLDRTARVCREALAHRDYPFDSLVDDLGVSVPQGKTPLFDVLIDYVPGPDAIGVSADEVGLGVSEYPRAVDAAHHEAMVLVGESDQGSRLSIQLVFHAGRFSEEAVALARTRLLAVLQWLTEDDARTLGDVDLLAAPARPRRRLHIGLNTS